MSDNGQKLLTLVVTGRNDTYYGNFIYRISTCINFLAYNLAKLDKLDDLEVMVTDWGSDVPLSRALTLTAEGARLARFVYVPREITRRKRPDGDFYPSCAINTSIRRGQGKYLMIFDADSLFPLYSVKGVIDLLEGRLSLPLDVEKAFFFFSRHQVPWELVQREPSIAEWERYLALNIGLLPRDQGPSGLGGRGAGQLMHRSIWHECRGYNESLIGQGWIDVEYTLRVTQRYPWMDLSGIGVALFHMKHWRGSIQGLWPNAVQNPTVVSPAPCANDEDWGLGEEKLEAVTLQAEAKAHPVAPFQGMLTKSGKTAKEFSEEMRHRDVARHVRRYLHAPARSTAEWEVLCALAWFSLSYYPARFIDTFARMVNPACIVGAANPGVEFYGIDTWKGVQWPREALTPEHVTMILGEVGYEGYTRFVSGDAETALERLKGSFSGECLFDLLLLRDNLIEIGTGSLEALLSLLAPGGMAVISMGSRDRLRVLLDGLKPLRKDLALITGHSGKTAFCLSLGEEQNRGEILKVVFGTPKKPLVARQVKRGIRTLARGLRKPQKALDYLKRACRSIIAPSGEKEKTP
ncbi:MAG: hypothetical protein RDV48_01770 [Candidatus Eremiobacteraeota bacterium]|nr:hypothetical protein [Candidatus Eremiobacteraeota bacterium]